MKQVRPKLLIITPSLSGGSFIALKHLAEAAKNDFNNTILGLGSSDTKNAAFNLIRIPYFRYDKIWGHLASKYTLFGFVSILPLYLIALFYIIKLRPRIIVYNGLVTFLPLVFIAKLLGVKKHVLSFRSLWDKKRFRFLEGWVKLVLTNIDLAFVNSRGTSENLERLIPEDKILIVNHHARAVFFEKRNRQQLRNKWKINKKFVVTFVGRIDEEKHCPFLFKIIRQFQYDKKIFFLFAGEGRLKNEVLRLTEKYPVRYVGYFKNPEGLAEIYALSDLLWSYADESYLSRPAVEAIASGTPVIVPEVPAIGEKIQKGERIKDNSILPPKIGWFVPLETEAVIRLLKKINKERLAFAMRRDCLEFGKKNFKADPNINLVKKLKQL